MFALVWGKMIWLYRRFSQKLAEFGVGIVPRQGWSAAEAFKEPTFGRFSLGRCFRLGVSTPAVKP